LLTNKDYYYYVIIIYGGSGVKRLGNVTLNLYIY